MLFIFIYSWFWILYFQMFDSVLWYVKDFVDASAIDNFMSKILWFNFKFDIETCNSNKCFNYHFFAINSIKYCKKHKSAANYDCRYINRNNWEWQFWHLVPIFGFL